MRHAMKPVSTVELREPVKLLDRVAGDILFRTVQHDVTLEMFLADVARAAAALPDSVHILNCCSHRYWFTVGFAAALVRGQVTIVAGDQSPRALGKLAARFGSLSAVTNVHGPALPVPHVVIGPDESAVSQAGPVPLIDGTRVALIVFTSGSTGEPEGTEKSFGELAARSRAAAARFEFGDDALTTMIGTVPANHMYGLETTVLLPLHARVASWCDPVFYPADLKQALSAQTGRSVLVTSPLQLRAMLEMTGAARFPDMVISATAPLDPQLAAQAEARWGTRVMEIFGATEVGSVASRRTVTNESWLVYPGVSLDGEDGPLVSADGAETRRLNDVVTLLDGGTRFRLIGRCGDLVKLGGRRASLAGLSRILLDIDGVSDGIFVAPDNLDHSSTARLVALMVSDVLSAADVLAALRTRMDPIFLPRPLLHVPALPRNVLGKLPRDALLPVLAQAPDMAARGYAAFDL